jgi:pantetheine-phosphate adenylyltransferase
MNKKMAPELESICFMASQEYQFLSSRSIREVSSLGGDISCLVPKNVAEAIERKGFIS